MKLIKNLFKLIVFVVVFLTISVGAVVIFVDPNEYKDEIISVAKQHIGRDLSILGKIEFSLFPWLGLKLGKVSLANPETFARPTFAEIDELDLRLSVESLLKGRSEIGVLHLNGLTLTLIQRQDGVNNWQDLAGGGDTDSTATEELSSSTRSLNIRVGGVQMKDANIHWYDEITRTEAHLTDFNLTVGAINPSEPIVFDARFTTASNKPTIKADISVRGDIWTDFSIENIVLKNLYLGIDAKSDILPGGQQFIGMNGELVYDVINDVANMNKLVIEAAGLSAQIDARATAVQTAPQIKGTLNIPTFSAVEMLKAWDIELPETTDSNALQAVTFDTTFTATTESVSLTNTELQLDDTRMAGHLQATLGQIVKARYDFAIDVLDADRYLPAAAKPSETAEATVPDSVVNDPEMILPIELLERWDVKGETTIGRLKLMNLDLRDVSITTAAKDDIAQLKLMLPRLYNGQAEALFMLDARKNTLYKARVDINKVQIGDLLSDFTQEPAFIKGKVALNVNVYTAGQRLSQLKQRLTGESSFRFEDGVINNVDIVEKLREAEAKIKRRKYIPSTQKPSTDFAAIQGKMAIKNGIAYMSDVKLKAPLLRATAQGSADLVNENLDMTLDAYIVSTKTGQRGKSLESVNKLLVPIAVKGPFTDISIQVLWERLLTDQTIALKAKSEAKVSAKRKLEAEKQRLKAKQAKAKRKLEIEKEKIKQKLQDNFKKLF